MTLDFPLNDTDRPRAPQRNDLTVPPSAQAHGDHLIHVHDMYRAELHELEVLVELVRNGRISAGQARAEIQQMTLAQRDWAVACVRYCSSITQHHTIEDQAMFPALRAFDSELEPVIDRLAIEHEAVHALVVAIDSSLQRFAQALVTSEDLENLVTQLSTLLRSHFLYEEEQLVQPLSRMAMAGVSPFG